MSKYEQILSKISIGFCEVRKLAKLDFCKGLPSEAIVYS